jgi:thymidine phosphorylase
LLELYTDTPDAVEGALQALEGAYEVRDSAPERSPLVIDTIRG